MTKKINHAERIMADNEGKEIYNDLVERAAGYSQAETKFEELTQKLESLGIEADAAEDILMDYGQAREENGFSAGFDLGFQEGGLLGAHGRKVS
jgi:curved DNA-binding protein CbpA